MGNKLLVRQRTIIGVIQLSLMALFWIWFLFFTPVTPLAGSLREGASAAPVPAEGFWGDIGFYARPADNGLTYFLMIIFCGLIVYKIITSCFFPHRRETRRLLPQERREKKCVRQRVRLRSGRF